MSIAHAELLAAIPTEKQEKALETIFGAGLDVAKTREPLMRVIQDPRAAAFDKSECTTCPFNSGSQRPVFQTHVKDGHCTNPPCFQLEIDAAAPGHAMKRQTSPPERPRPRPATNSKAAIVTTGGFWQRTCFRYNHRRSVCDGCQTSSIGSGGNRFR